MELLVNGREELLFVVQIGDLEELEDVQVNRSDVRPTEMGS